MATPFTNTRLSQSLALIGFHQTGAFGFPTPDPQELFKTTGEGEKAKANLDIGGVVNFGRSIAELVASFKPIGAVFGFQVSQRREIRPRRGIDSPIEAFAMVPGPQTTTLTLNRASIYLQDILGAFSFMPGNMAYQMRPMMILEITNLPGKENFAQSIASLLGSALNLEQANPVIYMGCWFTELTTSFDLKGSDQMVIQNATMHVTRVMNPLTLATANVGDIARKLGGKTGEVIANQLNSVPKVLASNVSIINRLKP